MLHFQTLSASVFCVCEVSHSLKSVRTRLGIIEKTLTAIATAHKTRAQFEHNVEQILRQITQVTIQTMMSSW